MCTSWRTQGSAALTLGNAVTVTGAANTAPTLSLPANITAEATSAAGALVTYTAAASDTQDGALTPSCTPASGTTFALGVGTVNCSVTDTGGLSASGSFTVTVRDTQKPTIAAHADVTAEATSSAGAVVSYTSPGTSDAVDGSRVATCAPASGTTFALGNTPVTCNATDAAGNAATPTTFVVHVVDTTAPVIGAHADVTAEATSASGALVTYTSPATSDAVDGAGTAMCLPASGSQFALATTTVTCSAADAAGNHAAQTTFTVTVRDTTAPTIAAHADVTAEATNASGALVTYTSPATTDAVDGAGTAMCLPASGSQFALGTTTVTCNASDAAGNDATATTFTVTVRDTTPPVLSLPANQTLEATGPNGAVATYTASATDTVDGARPIDCQPASGSTFALGTATVNCSASDTRGNTATGHFTVTVQDTTSARHVDRIAADQPDERDDGHLHVHRHRPGDAVRFVDVRMRAGWRRLRGVQQSGQLHRPGRGLALLPGAGHGRRPQH